MSNTEMNTRTFTDSHIISEVRAGNNWLYAELVRRYQRQVYSTIANLIGRCDELEDIGQEVFVRFYKSIHTFRGDSAVATYLTRIAINLSLNEIRRRKNWRNIFNRMYDAEDKEVVNIPDGTNNTENDILKEHLEMALNRLSPDFKTVVVLRLVEGYSVEETAEILGIASGTVMSRLSRAQQKLRKYLNH